MKKRVLIKRNWKMKCVDLHGPWLWSLAVRCGDAIQNTMAFVYYQSTNRLGGKQKKPFVCGRICLLCALCDRIGTLHKLDQLKCIFFRVHWQIRRSEISYLQCVIALKSTLAVMHNREMLDAISRNNPQINYTFLFEEWLQNHGKPSGYSVYVKRGACGDTKPRYWNRDLVFYIL